MDHTQLNSNSSTQLCVLSALFQLKSAHIMLVFVRRVTLQSCYLYSVPELFTQGDHLPGKPGNVTEFDSCQGNIRDFTKCQKCRGEILSGKSSLKLFIVSCVFAST